MTETQPIIDSAEVEAAAPASADKLETIRAHARKFYANKRRMKKLMEEVEGIQGENALLEEKTIPDAMRDAGMKSFELDGGFRVDLEDYMHGSVTKANEPAFFDWLEANNYGSIIKHVLTISFGKGEDAWARKFMADLAKRKKPIPVERKDGIHAGTLKSFFKERFGAEKEGKVPEAKRIPRDIVGVHEGTRAVLFDPAEEAERAAKRAKSAKSDKVEM